uniref:Uncharacterized protein n=1 Tax=Globodera rostochiensis TaxID=31243 RepID=A0A914I2B0_GLORO
MMEILLRWSGLIRAHGKVFTGRHLPQINRNRRDGPAHPTFPAPHQNHPTLIRATPAHRRITVARCRLSKPPQCRARYSQHSQISRPINQPH